VINVQSLFTIQTQFHHLIKTIPQHGQIIHNLTSPAIDETLSMGTWSELQSFTPNNDSNADWACEKITPDASAFKLTHQGESFDVHWSLIGDHNMANALAAIAAAHHVGIQTEHAVASLSTFKSVKRRLEKIFDNDKIRIYDDFAHHPTAITETLRALRNNVGKEPIIAVLEPRSNTMKRGVHKHLLSASLDKADDVLIYADENVQWDISDLSSDYIRTFNDTHKLLNALCLKLEQTDETCNVVIMSNGGFDNLYQRLIKRLTRN